jgi:DNA-binding transcriptional MocR family regulator
MNDLLENLKDDPQKLGMAVLGTVGVVVGLASWFNPDAVATRKDLRQQDKAAVADLVENRQAQRHLEQMASIAQERYDEGCRLVAAQDGSGQLISLAEGMMIIDPLTQNPLADGTTVCSGSGETGVMAGGVITKLAVTNDQAVVDKAIAEGKAR